MIRPLDDRLRIAQAHEFAAWHSRGLANAANDRDHGPALCNGRDGSSRRPDRAIGRISRQWFNIRDTYGVEVEPGEDPALVIAVAVCVDRLREQARRRAMSSG